MTLGVTGVVWFPRTATGNSTALIAGTGPAPLGAAAGAWTSIATSFTDAAGHIGSIMAALGAGWEGAAADSAQAKLGSFLAWTEKTAADAAIESGKAAGQSAVYTTALATMPTLVEIAAVKATVAASYGAGGALNGGALAAEAADKALDLRAAAVMEAYEAASSHLAVPAEFHRPPTIVTDASSDGAAQVQDARTYQDKNIRGGGSDVESTRPTLATTPAQAAMSAVTAATQNPAFASAAGQVGSAAGSVASTGVSTAASAAGTIGSGAASALGGGASAGAGVGGYGSSSAATGPASTRPVSAGGSGGAGIGSSGIGGIGGGGTLSAGGGSSLGVGAVDKPSPTSQSVLSGQAQGSAVGRGGTGGPMAGAKADDDSDEEHRSPSYLRDFEHFADGRTVAPSVIGADATWTEN